MLPCRASRSQQSCGTNSSAIPFRQVALNREALEVEFGKESVAHHRVVGCQVRGAIAFASWHVDLLDPGRVDVWLQPRSHFGASADTLIGSWGQKPCRRPK